MPYNVWWVTAIGQERAQEAMKPLLGIPDELAVLDIFCFGPASKPPYKRFKKSLDQIASRDRFNADQFMTDDDLDQWIKTRRHRVMYRDADNVDRLSPPGITTKRPIARPYIQGGRPMFRLITAAVALTAIGLAAGSAAAQTYDFEPWAKAPTATAPGRPSPS